MNAKEMFEDCDYKLKSYSKYTYMKYVDRFDENKYIEFWLDCGGCMILSGFNGGVFQIKLLKAINQQCKELGWLEKEKQQ